MQNSSTDKPRRPRKERPQRDGMIGAARQLRSNPTEAETVLWEALRRKQADGMRFRRQRVIGPYIVDFCCLGHNLIVEVDGAHHHDSEYAAYDADRTEFLEAHGFRVLRFDNSAVLDDVDEVVRRILDPSPGLSPLRRGEENDPSPDLSPLRRGEENDPSPGLSPLRRGEATEPSHPRTGERAG